MAQTHTWSFPIVLHLDNPLHQIGEGEATLKRFYREGAGKVRLQPANSEMAPILVPANDVRIQGRVIGVLRKY